MSHDYFRGLMANNSCPYSIGAHCLPPVSSRSRRPRRTRFHSSASWLPRCTESARLPPRLPASQKAEIREKATRRTCRQWENEQYATLPRAPQAQLVRQRQEDRRPGLRARYPPRGRRRRRGMYREKARSGAAGAAGSPARLILTLTSPRSSSNSAISFSIKNSMSSFSSF